MINMRNATSALAEAHCNYYLDMVELDGNICEKSCPISANHCKPVCGGVTQYRLDNMVMLNAKAMLQ